jgi:hypothetical protein
MPATRSRKNKNQNIKPAATGAFFVHNIISQAASWLVASDASSQRTRSVSSFPAHYPFVIYSSFGSSRVRNQGEARKASLERLPEDVSALQYHCNVAAAALTALLSQNEKSRKRKAPEEDVKTDSVGAFLYIWI